MPPIDPGTARPRPGWAAAPQPVVLLHGSAATGAQWFALRAALEPRFCVHAPDLHGYGDGPAWSGATPLTLSAEARPILQLIEGCAEPVHLVGHSYGGAVALRVALEAPTLLRSLTLIEPVAFHLLRAGEPADHALLAEIARLAGDVGEAVASGRPAAGMARFVDYWNGRDAWARLRPPTQEALAGCAGKVVQDFWATTTEGARADDYRVVATPTLVLHGERSPAVTRRIARMLARLLPEAELLAVRDAGHRLPLTHAEDVNAVVAAHLAQHATARGRLRRRPATAESPTTSPKKEMSR